MESDINHVHLTGTVETDAEMRSLPNGKVVTNFLLRVNEVVTTRDGSQIPLSNLVKIVAWNSLAEPTRDQAKAGARLCCHGRIHVSQWVSRQGEKNTTYETHLTKKIQTVEEWVESLPSPAPLTPKLNY